MIAARFPPAPSRTNVSVCWPERMLSAELKVLACEYLHRLREQRLSDHSALELDFDI
jgi:hypothetical protein